MTFESINKNVVEVSSKKELIDVRLFINSYFVLALKFSNKNCKNYDFLSQF